MADEEQSMVCSCNVIHTFHGGSTQKFLTRNRIILHPENEHDLLACTGDEATQCVSFNDYFIYLSHKLVHHHYFDK